MRTSTDLGQGAILRRSQLEFAESPGYRIATLIGPEDGARNLEGAVIEIRPGAEWPPAVSEERETIIVVFAGAGSARIRGEVTPLAEGRTLYAPTGVSYSVRADREMPVTLYAWRSTLPSGTKTSAAPRLASSLFNSETVLAGYGGTEQGRGASEKGAARGPKKPARMNFVFWPGTGSARLCLHCGIQEPGESFAVHTHPASEELFIAFEGEGQCFLGDRWHDMGPGDALYAPPGVPHGTRNPNEGPGADRFVTCGGPAPFDPALYAAAGLSAEVK
jgi:quercetin dioxygenase-like cupin family protein